MKSKQLIKVGIFGIGQFGIVHLKNWLEIENIQVLGFCDIDPMKQGLIPREFGIPYMEQKELIAAADVLDIVTPTYSHFEIAKEALAAGKHVFVEKPFTETLAEAGELLEIATQNQVQIAVGLIERFNPVITALKHRYDMKPAFIESHRMGQFNPYRGTDVPVIMELMIHDIDLILHLVNHPVKDIAASGTKVLSGEIDIVNARIEFENGTVANITSSRIAPAKMRKIRFFQKDHYFSVDFIEQKADIYTIQNGESVEGADNEKIMVKIPVGFNKQIHFKELRPKSYNAMQREFNTFIEAVKNHTRPVVSGEDGYKALDLAIRIKERIDAHQFK